MLRQQSSRAVAKLDSYWRSLSAGSRGFSHKSRHVQKAVYNVRLTVLCGIITILVLRGTIGTGIFSSDSEPPPATIEERLPRETVHEVIEEDPPIDESVPFALGLNITDWDETRAEWLRNHPEMTKNKFGKERVFLISGSASKPCKNPVGDHLLVKGLKNKIDYTRFVRFFFHSMLQSSS